MDRDEARPHHIMLMDHKWSIGEGTTIWLTLHLADGATVAAFVPNGMHRVRV